MRMMWRFLSVFVVVFALGCGGPESSYENREQVPDGQSDPANAMTEMGKMGNPNAPAPKGGSTP